MPSDLLLGYATTTFPYPDSLVVLVLSAFVFLLYREAYRTDVPKVAKIPEAGGDVPFTGHLLPLGGRKDKNDSTVYTEWAEQTNSDIFQIRLGSQRALVVSSFQAVKDIWLGHSTDLIDRPYQHGFADKLGLDVSGAAMTGPIRRCRKAAMRALGRPMWPSYYSLLESQSVNLVQNIYVEGQNGKVPLEIYKYLRQLVFDLVLSLTYAGRQMDADDPFILELIGALSDISEIRSSTQRFRDYIPLLRLIPERQSKVINAEKVRRKYLAMLYASLQKRLNDGEKINCVVTNLDKDKLSEEEVHGTCTSLLQAAPDSTASGIYVCLIWLCSPEGRSFQTEVYNAILTAYDGDKVEAWKMAFREEKVPLIVSLYKEALRYFSTAPFATPRTTVKTFTYKGVEIPKGITMIMNAQAANHDKSWFGEDAKTFVPTRFLNNDTSLPHLNFGAGSRICPAVAISNRIIYAVLTRLILAFDMGEADGPSARKPNTHWLDFSDVYSSLVAIPRAFDCYYKPRDEYWLNEILEMERNLA